MDASDFDIEREWQRLRQKLDEIYYKNYDSREKGVGDKVLVWDGSSVTDEEGNRYNGIDVPFSERDYFVVVATKQNNRIKSRVCDNYYLQDLMIVDIVTNKMYHVSSDHVKRID